MFELFDADQKQQMFYPPNRAGGEQKYDWYNMEVGQWFFIPCSSIKSKHYRPAVPKALLDEGFDISVSKRSLKESGDEYFVVTRTE